VSESTKNGLATGLHPHPQGSLKRSPKPLSWIYWGRKEKEGRGDEEGQGKGVKKEEGKRREGENVGGKHEY